MHDISEIPLLQIVWNQGLSVGNAEMDRDHEQFIAIVNELNQAIIRQETRTQILQRLQLIILEAKGHFEREQRLFDEQGYPGAANHSFLHTKLMGEIVGAMTLFRDSEVREHWIKASLLIKGLLIEHLLNEDVRYGEFLKSRASADEG
jgi:hemerythrin